MKCLQRSGFHNVFEKQSSSQPQFNLGNHTETREFTYCIIHFKQPVWLSAREIIYSRRNYKCKKNENKLEKCSMEIER